MAKTISRGPSPLLFFGTLVLLLLSSRFLSSILSSTPGPLIANHEASSHESSIAAIVPQAPELSQRGAVPFRSADEHRLGASNRTSRGRRASFKRLNGFDTTW